MYGRRENRGVKINIWSKTPPKNPKAPWAHERRGYHGTITRKPQGERMVGNWGGFWVSVLGKKYNVVGNDLTLPIAVIKELKRKGQLKKPMR